MEDDLKKALAEAMLGVVEPLMARISALEFTTLALALALVENDAVSGEKLKEAAEFMGAFASATEGEDVARLMQPMLDRLRVLSQSAPTPRASFATHLALFAAAGPKQRDALLSWLSQATEAEIGEDIAELLKRLAKKK